MRRPLALCGVIAAFGLAAPAAHAQAADPCTTDHVGNASVILRGDVATVRAITDGDLRAAVAAGTMTAKTEVVTYNTGNTPTHRSYVGVSLYDVMTKLVTPQFDTTLKNPGLRYFLAVTANDAYRVLLSWGDLDPGFGNRSDILLAYDERNDDTHEEGFHSLDTTGPRLIVPGDVKGGRYVSCVRDIRLGSADDSAGDDTPQPTVQGSPGAPGATGATGATGAAGKNGTDAAAPTCTVSGLTVRCTASLISNQAHAKLTRLGKVMATGTMRRLVASGKLEKGKRYTLRLRSGSSAVIHLT